MTQEQDPILSLQQGEALLAAGDSAGAAKALGEARRDARTRLTAHNLIERHGLDDGFGHWMGLNCEISPQDDIFRFFDGHPTSINPLRDYLADGWRTLAELMLLLESAGRPLLGVGSFLEFASGHGRFTRHLVKAIGAERVVASDVVTDAVDFARETLGVRAFASAARPEELVTPERYEVVFVLSLFSHLPKSSWSRWLTRLYDCVAPGGLLVFTTHGAEAVRRQGVTLDDEGFFFAPSSESNAIDAQEYGTAFTSADFVEAQITQHIGASSLLRHAPTWFWHHQDAWVIQRP
ncbi:SAM-dependent methyltransferase [Ottowia thiooxydans]|uniref:SAM-dependent methyltransferase n=1 Tax=Ottowia thiooxydans TaxID=219182 RepID=UPI000426E0EA|nr:class I SAM-dependent methyltransferase [Ottowia thiooxydans]